MKRLGILLLMIVGMTTMAMAQAEIKFNETTHNFGTISKKTPVQKCTFTFTNTLSNAKTAKIRLYIEGDIQE